MSDYLLKRRAISQGLAEKDPTKKEPKPIPKKSAKRIEEDKKYKKILEEKKRTDGDQCCVQSPACIGLVQGMNHKQKRSPDNLLKPKNLELCCDPCNGFIELNKEWAIANGHFISRFDKLTLHEETNDLKITVTEKI